MNGFPVHGIPDDGNTEPDAGECFRNQRRKMGRRHKIDVMHAFVLESVQYGAQSLHCDFTSAVSPADAVILTEDTAQIASGKENGAAASCSAQTGLFPEMYGGTCDPHRHGRGTETAGSRRRAVCSAGTGTEAAGV